MMVERDRNGKLVMRDRRSLIGDDHVCAGGRHPICQRPFGCLLKTATSSITGDDGLGVRLLLARPARLKRRGVGTEAASATQSP